MFGSLSDEWETLVAIAAEKLQSLKRTSTGKNPFEVLSTALLSGPIQSYSNAIQELEC